jgi:hypothetical protein
MSDKTVCTTHITENDQESGKSWGLGCTFPNCFSYGLQLLSHSLPLLLRAVHAHGVIFDLFFYYLCLLFLCYSLLFVAAYAINVGL